jgi:pimeloyl-ACP methyl ester carboxylesterase
LPIRSFRIAVPESMLDRIQQRLRNVQWPRLSRDAGWQYGVEREWFAELVGYWRTDFSWRLVEQALNETPQFVSAAGGRQLHFARFGEGPPLLLLHGWPYSFATMLPLGQLLAQRGFEVIVPSCPGSVFSSPVEDRVRGLRASAERIAALMRELGHERYLVHGGDHGAVIADWLAIDRRAAVRGIHAHMIGFRQHGAEFGSGQTGVHDATPEEEAFVKAEAEVVKRESAYFQVQSTRPETIAYALTDSPVGWAAYMLDKWQKWSVPFDHTRERLLTEVMLYLVSESVATSLWPYAGFMLDPFSLEPGQTIDVPYGYSSYDDPLAPRVPRHFSARSRTDIRFWREHQGGGHFPMLGDTAGLADDIEAFARAC